MNYGHLFGTLVIDKLCYCSNIQIKYMDCILLQISMYQLSFASTPGLHHPNQPWTHLKIPKSTAQRSPLTHYISTRDIGGPLPSTLWKVGKMVNYFTFYGKKFVSSCIFCIKAKNVKLPRCFTFLCVFFFLLLVGFAIFLPFCPLQKLSLLSYPFPKIDPRLCNTLLRHCI